MYLFRFADSMTSFTSFIIGTAILVSPFLKKHVTKIFIIGIFCYTTGLGDFLYYSFSNLFFGILGKEATLTGRVDLWAAVLDMKHDPILGTGYNSFWNGDRLRELWQVFIFRPKQAHNGYIEIYLHLGIVGLIFLILALLSSFKKLTYEVNPKDAFWPFQISYFTVYLLHNVTEATFLFNLSPLWFVFLFTVFSTTMKNSGSFVIHKSIK